MISFLSKAPAQPSCKPFHIIGSQFRTNALHFAIGKTGKTKIESQIETQVERRILQQVWYDESSPAHLTQEVDVVSSHVARLRPFLQARLSWRIVLWVFASILLVEAVILLPSVQRRQRELLSQLQTIAAAEATGTLSTLPTNGTDREILQRLQLLVTQSDQLGQPRFDQSRLIQSQLNQSQLNQSQLNQSQLNRSQPSWTRPVMLQSHVLGGTLYRSTGEPVGSFGEAPRLSWSDVQNQSIERWQSSHYESVLPIASLSNEYILIVRQDATPVQQETIAFIGRIAVLVAIIAVFVTLVTMIGMQVWLIHPILLLRRDLMQAGEAIAHDQPAPEFQSLTLRRQDELGEVIAAFNQMHQQVLGAIAERQQAAQNSARLAEIGELSAMIIHEVRNPLTTVMMGLRALQKLELSTIDRERLDLSMDEANRLQRLLNEILSYTRCQKLDTIAIEVNEFIKELLETIQTMPVAHERRINWQPVAEPVWIAGDRDKLKQVFINLISNACEAIEPQETIHWTIHTSDHASESAQVDICIRNYGKPIPPDVLPKLTKPFYTTKATGNGLGLAIVQRIIAAHAGELSIESSIEQGTIVKVRLPQI